MNAQTERIQARLADPRTADALERLLDKLDVVAFGVEAVDSFLRRSEEVADSLSETIREMKSMNGNTDFVFALPQLARAGTQMAAASQRAGFQNLLASGLLDQLGDPQTIANIQTVLGKLEVAAFAMTAIDGFAKRGDEITDSVRESLQDVRGLASSIDLTKLKLLYELLDNIPALLEGVKPLRESFEEAKRVPPHTTSLLGILRALRDPDTNRSVTLALDFAKQYGKRVA